MSSLIKSVRELMNSVRNLEQPKIKDCERLTDKATEKVKLIKD